ncbi:MAG: hypothetical protein U1E17_09010 [Geminicoccaceae bacterium]
MALCPSPKSGATPELAAQILAGAYWLEPPRGRSRAGTRLRRRGARPGAGGARRAALLGRASCSSPPTSCTATGAARGPPGTPPRLLALLAADAGLVTVLDGHPATLSWLGAVRGQRVQALGGLVRPVRRRRRDLYRTHGLDADAILDAAARACLRL